jgi:hypothetical protein
MLSYFASEKISDVLIRPGSGQYQDGEWVPDSPGTTNIEIIAPQPMRPDELQMLPQGERVYNHLVTWMTPEIRNWPVVPGSTSTNPDILRIDGSHYKVMEISNRSVLGNFYRVVLREFDYTPPVPPS